MTLETQSPKSHTQKDLAKIISLLPPMPETNLQIEANKKDHKRIKMPEPDVPEEAKGKLNTLLEGKYNNILSKSATDIGRNNLIELAIPTKGPCMSCRPYSIPLKHTDFVDEEIQQLEDAGIISRSMSNWASPILVVPKKPMPLDPKSSNKKQFNLRLCINYRKLNSQIITVRQVKSNGTLGKVVVSYPLPTIDTLLARFKDCKYFSTLDLRSGYYHIKLTKEASAKTAFVTDKGKWQFHSLPFGINLGASVFSYILGTMLKHCQAFALNYLDDIIIFLKSWVDHLEHLKQAFKALQGADLKIKQSKCKFFKSKVHYLGYIVGTDGVEPLPEKLEAIQKLAAC